MHPCDNTETLLRVLAPPRRNHYFYGKRMDVQHFQMEQDYGKLKQWLLNRLTLGKGVLCGLRVSLADGKVCVDPGVAIDGLGREIIVPVRACLDPVTGEGGCCEPCCSEPAAKPPPYDRPGSVTHVPAAAGVPPAAGANAPNAPAAAPSAHAPDSAVAVVEPADDRKPKTGFYTLWVCYKECRTDYQPVLVSDCDAREHCAPGTIVESFCLKATPGLPPLQGDPEWCAKLWGKQVAHVLNETPAPAMAAAELALHKLDAADMADAKAALRSRRHLLCELFDRSCDPPEGDPCVPLAALLLRDGRVEKLESCLVRPRIYSNAVLLDLILCLADKIEECCDHDDGDTPPPPQPKVTMRVKSVEFLGGPNNQVIATVQSPKDTTKVPIGGQGRFIRVTFTRPIDQGANKPTTPGLNDAGFKKHNVLVLPEGGGPAAGVQYAPGKVTVVAPDTILWELHKESPFYSGQHKGWQKGTLRLALFASDDPGTGRKALKEAGGEELDGEPTAPTGGAISGDGTKGGDFSLVFNVG